MIIRFFSKIYNSNIGLLFFSLIASIGLVIYVSSISVTSASTSDNPFRALLTTQTTTITAPVKVVYDDQKFYVSGAPKTVQVELSGPSSLLTAAKNSTTIQAVLDLSNFSAGLHQVNFSVNGLSSSVQATVNPSSASIQIATRTQKTVKINGTYDASKIASGLTTKNFSMSQQTAVVIGPKSLVDAVSSVSAILPVSEGLNKSISSNATLSAVDSSGNVIDDVTISPQTITLQLDLQQVNSDSSSSSLDPSSSSSSSSN